MQKLKDLFNKYQEPILYIFFGGITTLINWVAYVLLLNAFSYGVSNGIAWVIAVIFAFIVNKIFVFKSKDTGFLVVLKEALMFLAARAFSGIVDILGLPLLVSIGLDQEIFGIEGALAKLAITVVVLIINYVFSKFAIFRKKKG